MLNRKYKRKRKRKADSEEEEDNADEGLRVVGLATFEAYAAAIVDLYNQQKDLGANNPHPKKDSARYRQLIESVKTVKVERKRLNRVDRGVDTYADGHSNATQLEKLADWFFM